MAAKFLSDSALNSALERIFQQAKTQLILISPYIKLHDRFKSILRSKLEDDGLFIQVVFGKNDEAPQKSMGQDEIEFFMKFPNVEVRHERRLHAKYYTNDTEAIITSMNLYSYSQDNNIESGVLTSATVLGNLANRLSGNEDVDNKAMVYFERVINQADLIFKREPQYEKAMFGLAKRYTGSITTTDKVKEFLGGRSTPPSTTRTKEPPPTSKNAAPRHQPEPAAQVQKTQRTSKPTGYCIRTGAPIPFNIKRPLSDEGYKSWSRYKDENYAERYCHFSGEPSNGNTSFAKPILHKHWSVAKERYDL